jgi:hypothetical protein
MASLKHVHAPGRLIIWCPFKPICFKLFWPRIGLVNFISVCTQTADNFWRKSIACVNCSLLALYFQLIQWCLSTYMLTPWAAARLAHLLEQHSHHCKAIYEKSVHETVEERQISQIRFPQFSQRIVLYICTSTIDTYLLLRNSSRYIQSIVQQYFFISASMHFIEKYFKY